MRGRLREDILLAADHLLFEKGDAHGVSIDAVTAMVGCTPPALYYYFASKEALLFEVCSRRFHRFAADLESSLPETDDPLVELLARGHAYLDWASAHPEHYRILFMTIMADPSSGDTPDPSQAAGMVELLDNLRRAVAVGLLPPGDLLHMALALWSTVHGMASLVVANPTLPQDFAHAVVDFTGGAVLRGLGASL